MAGKLVNFHTVPHHIEFMSGTLLATKNIVESKWKQLNTGKIENIFQLLKNLPTEYTVGI